MKISASEPITKLWITPVSPSAGQQQPQGHRLSILSNAVLEACASRERIISSLQCPKYKQALKKTSSKSGWLSIHCIMQGKMGQWTTKATESSMRSMPGKWCTRPLQNRSLRQGSYISDYFQSKLSLHRNCWLDFFCSMRIVENTDVSKTLFFLLLVFSK